MKLYATIRADHGKRTAGTGGDKWLEIDLNIGNKTIGRIILDHQGGQDFDLSYENADGTPSRIIDSTEK